jgi:hypothetical protein
VPECEEDCGSDFYSDGVNSERDMYCKGTSYLRPSSECIVRIGRASAQSPDTFTENTTSRYTHAALYFVFSDTSQSFKIR